MEQEEQVGMEKFGFIVGKEIFMKRMCAITILFAVAFVMKIEKVYKDPNNLVRFDIPVAYIGNDVPAHVDVESLSITISSTTTLGQIASVTAAFIRTDATARGYTVGVGNVILPSFTSN